MLFAYDPEKGLPSQRVRPLANPMIDPGRMDSGFQKIRLYWRSLPYTIEFIVSAPEVKALSREG
jgi:hypothetical protein